MIKFSRKFAKKTFTADTTKDAYMSAVKWYATNVISKDELRNVQVEFEKDKQSPSVTIHLYAVLDESEVMKQHCKCCEEMHSSFFINKSVNCNVCALKGYKNRLEQKIKIKYDYYRELFRKHVEE